MLFVVATIAIGVSCALVPVSIGRTVSGPTQSREAIRPRRPRVARATVSVRSVRTRSPETPSRGARLAVGLGITLLFAYQLIFNLLPDHLRVLMAGAISGYCLYFLFLVGLTVKAERRTGRIWSWLAAVAVIDLAALMIGLHTADFTEFTRKFFPFAVAAYLLRNPTLVPKRLVILLASGTALIGSMYSLVVGTAYYSDVARLAPFTGGDDGTHSSSYVLVCCSIIVVEAWFAGEIGKRRALTILVPTAAALIGLAVGTALVMILAYCGARLWSRSRDIALRVAAVALAAVALILVFAQRTDLHEHAQYRATTTGADAVSSGRLTTWKERAAIIDGRSKYPLLFGEGVGSDHYASAVWSGLLDSHEDYLTLILENGILGFFAIMCALGAIYKRAGPSVIPLAIAAASASLISNALFARPMIACLFFVAVALVSELKDTARLELAASSAQNIPKRSLYTGQRAHVR